MKKENERKKVKTPTHFTREILNTPIKLQGKNYYQRYFHKGRVAKGVVVWHMHYERLWPRSKGTLEFKWIISANTPCVICSFSSETPCFQSQCRTQLHVLFQHWSLFQSIVANLLIGQFKLDSHTSKRPQFCWNPVRDFAL